MYSVNLAQGPWHLYNLDDDPYEMNNLVSESSLQSTRKELHERLVRQAERIGDDFFARLASGKAVPAAIRSRA
jgi:hypothetical protein